MNFGSEYGCGCGCPSYSYGYGAAPVGYSGYRGGFALIVVLFLLLIIVGVACY